MAELAVDIKRIKQLLTKRKLDRLGIEYLSTDVVRITEGIVGTDDGEALMEVTSNIDVDISGNGANGLDTGSVSNDTWYYLFLILNPTSGTVAGLFSLSDTAPTMPSGYTKKRLVSVLRYFTADFLNFKQYNCRVFYPGPQTVLSGGGSTSRTQIDISNYVPDTYGQSARLLFMSNWNNDFGNSAVYLEGLSGSTYHYTRAGLYAGSWWYRFRQTNEADIGMFYDSTMRVYYYTGDSDCRCSIFVKGYTLRL